MTRPAVALESELATPLTPEERAIGGCARTHGASPVGSPEPGSILALWRLLVHVMEDHAPDPALVATGRAYDRSTVRHWAERELCRTVVGVDGCPSIAPPAAIARHVERWRRERLAIRATAASAALARVLP